MKEKEGEPAMAESIRELVEYIAKVLVDRPEQVRVSEMEGENTSILELTVASEDMGKIIGKQGRTAIAIRTILNNAAMKIRRRCVLEILD